MAFSLALPISVAAADENEAHRFVAEYIRELGATEHLNDAAKVNPEEKNTAFLKCVRTDPQYGIELLAQIAILKTMKFSGDQAELLDTIMKANYKKISYYDAIKKACDTFVSGPKREVEYDHLFEQIAQITAKLEYIDKALFEASPLIFATLLDSTTDTKNSIGRLVITNAERQDLISKIDAEFGNKLTQENQNYTVSSASSIKAYLKKDFKSADEPRESPERLRGGTI
jgi:hypothetical protein